MFLHPCLRIQFPVMDSERLQVNIYRYLIRSSCLRDKLIHKTHTHTHMYKSQVNMCVCSERSVRLGCRCTRRQPYRHYRSHCYRVYKYTHSCTTTTRPPLTMCCRVFGQYLPRQGRIFLFVICYQIIPYSIGGTLAISAAFEKD